MKKDRTILKIIIPLVIILSLVFASTCSSQTINIKTHESSAWVKVALLSGSIVLDAVGDGLNDNGQKQWGHLANAASIGCLLAVPLFTDFKVKDIAGVILLRIGLFDPMYNAVRGLPLGYTGSTSYYDKAWQKLNPPGNTKLIANTLFFTVGVSVTLKYN